MMPYSTSLYSLADWFRQLWAESLGKQNGLKRKNVFAGQTPVKALGHDRSAFTSAALSRRAQRQADHLP